MRASLFLALILSAGCTPQSVEDIFEEAGYESANFFLELGPLLLLIISFIIYVPFAKVCQVCARKRTKQNCLTKRWAQPLNLRPKIARFFIEAVIEMGLSALICLRQASTKNFEAFWEAFSTASAMAFCVLCLLVPIYLLSIKKRFKREIRSTKKSQY